MDLDLARGALGLGVGCSEEQAASAQPGPTDHRRAPIHGGMNAHSTPCPCGLEVGHPHPPRVPFQETAGPARPHFDFGADSAFCFRPINGELVDRKKQRDRHIKVSLAKETAKASGESEPIADLEGWVGRISTFLTNQWFLKNVKPHLEGMREREITYEEAKPHLIAGNYEFYLSS